MSAILDQKGVAKLLGTLLRPDGKPFSTRAIRDMHKDGLPHVAVRRTISYDTNAVTNWVKTKRRGIFIAATALLFCLNVPHTSAAGLPIRQTSASTATKPAAEASTLMRVPAGEVAVRGVTPQAQTSRHAAFGNSMVLSPVPRSHGVKPRSRQANHEPDALAVMPGGDASAAGRLWLGIDLDRLAQAESLGNDSARGKAGERGRFQITPGAIADVNAARKRDGLQSIPASRLADAATARHVARQYLSILARRVEAAGFKPTPNAILCAWNDGVKDARRYGFDISKAPAATRRLAQ